MSGIIDRLLLSPKNIDFYFYAPGAGGEFLSSLAAIANRKNHKIMPNPEYKVRKRIATDINGEKVESTVFLSPRYFSQLELAPSGIENICYNFFRSENFLPDPIERITYTKIVLFHYLQSFLFYHDENRPYSFYNDVSIILCTHWARHPIFDSRSSSPKLIENFKKRTLGIPKFEEQPYWDIINIDPQTERGKNFVKKWCIKTRLVKQHEESIIGMINHKAFQNIKLKFPFMDYMIEKDYDSIKYWIENRYGSDLDFDFIDQSLVNYRKIRIDPWL